MNDELKKRTRGRYNTWRYDPNVQMPSSTRYNHQKAQKMYLQRQIAKSMKHSQTGNLIEPKSETNFSNETLQMQNNQVSNQNYSKHNVISKGKHLFS